MLVEGQSSIKIWKELSKPKPSRRLVPAEHKCESGVERSLFDINLFHLSVINIGTLKLTESLGVVKTGALPVDAFSHVLFFIRVVKRSKRYDG